MKRALSFAILAAAILLPAHAFALPNFPGDITAHLSLGYTPDCLLCHNTPAGGLGTAVTPFATSMQARGLSAAGGTPSLNTALDALAAEGTDSDGDGVGDIAELQAHTDPNAAGGKVIEPKYGCGGGDLTAPLKPSLAAGLFGLAGLALFAVRRRRS